MRTPFVRFNKTILTLIVGSTAIVAAACGGGSPTAPSSGGSSGTSGTSGSSQQQTVTGIYQLATVNGKSVPCVFDSYSPGQGVTMNMQAIRGSIVLNGDGTYMQEYEMRLTATNMPDQVMAKKVTGTYAYEASTLTLSPAGGQPFTPAFATGRIEIVAEAPALDGGTDFVTFTYRQ